MARAPGSRFVTVGGALVVVAVVLGSCRDEPELLEPPELEPLGPAPYQLTFDPGRDVSPAWSASGDSIIYVTERLIPPATSDQDTARIGRPLRVIHREGGTARKVFPLLQPGEDGTLAIDYATQSVDERVAVFTLLPILDVTPCRPGAPACDVAAGTDTFPRLDRGLIRVRRPGSAESPVADVQLEVLFPGRAFDTAQNPDGLDGVWVTDQYPFQRRFNGTRRAPDRLSWAPGGDRLVFSDGTSLHAWTPGGGAPAAIPNTQDGVDPAWSPTGQWIAFERAGRGAVSETTCEYRFEPGIGPLICLEQRRSWPLLGRSLAVVRPDGSDLRLLPEGARPAWHPEGQRIYYEFDTRIWSVAVDGSDAAPVPATTGGYQPAVSPDGRWLAFARIDSLTAASNIWIVELEP